MKLGKILTPKTVLLIVTLLTLTGCGIKPAPDNDPSIGVLHSIFGVYASNALSGTFGANSLIFSDVFKDFNTALLSGALCIFAYMLIAGTIYTAQDGVFLGKKWAKTFIPLRAIIGCIAIVPIGQAGFCLAQWVIYSMAFIGISIANSVWMPIAPNTASSKIKPHASSLPLSAQNVILKGMQEIFFDQSLMTIINQTGSAITPQIPSITPTSQATKIPITINNKPANLTWFQQSNPWMKNLYTNLNTWCDTLNASTSCKSLITQTQKNAQNPLSGPVTFPARISILQNINAAPAFYQSRLNYSIPASSDNYLQFTISSNKSHYKPVITARKLSTKTATSLNKSSASATKMSTIMNGEVNAFMGSEGYQGILNYMTTHPYKPTPSQGGLPIIPIAPKGPQIPNASVSWWNAGNEYLTLDMQFAKADEAIEKSADQFAIKSDGEFAELEHIENGKYTFKYALNQKIAGIKNGTFSGTVDFPDSESSISQYATLLGTTAATWTGTNKSAGLDLACKLGDSEVCNDPSVLAYDDLYDGAAPHPYQLQNGPFPNIVAHLQYYFGFRKYIARNGYKQNAHSVPLFNPIQIKKIDAYLTFVKNLTTAPGNIPGDNGSSFNPFVIAGENSPMHNVMGFLFSGLIGYKYGSQSVGGLLQQVWCVGSPKGLTDCPYTKSDQSSLTPITPVKTPLGIFGTTSQATPTPVSPPKNTVNELVTDHFDIIRNAQLVGLNLISGSVDAMTKIFQNFTAKVKAVLASQSHKGLNTGDIIGLSVIGPIGSAIGKASTVKAQTGALIAIAGLSVDLMWLPVIFVVLTTLFVTGIMFAILIPITPYILFWSGKIAWLLLVLEGLIAAPIMALGIAYPDGHDIWGMAENGFKTSLNLLLLPVLLVIGLISSMVLTYVVIHFSAVGFHWVSASILEVVDNQSSDPNINLAGNSNSIIVQGIMATFIIFMYATFISMAFNKCFSTIYLIPEKVMTWIGGQGAKFGKEDAEKMSQATNQLAEKAGQAGGQTVSQGTQAEANKGNTEANQSAAVQQSEIGIGEAGVGEAATVAKAAMGGE